MIVEETESGVAQQYKVVYFGTPSYAVPTLEKLATDPRFDIRLVVTQPDRPSGRRRDLTAPPVKLVAQQYSLPVYQPESLKSADSRSPLIEADADVFVVAAYGLIFGQRTLSIPRFGSINLHASLLPKYRGAAPVCAAILAGEAETGITMMMMERGLDTGPIIAASPITIRADDTTESLTDSLAQLGAELAVSAIPAYLEGRFTPEPQEGAATVVRQLTKADGWIDWQRDSDAIDRHIRAMWPWPRAWTSVDAAEALQIHAARSVEPCSGLGPGEIGRDEGRVLVGTGSGVLELQTIQPSGRAAMEAIAWLRGMKVLSSTIFLGRSQRPNFETPLIQAVAD
jgi:methionyl-tRNA formyltransferase